MKLIDKAGTVALVACSDGLRRTDEPLIRRLKAILTVFGLNVKTAKALYRGENCPFNAPPADRASTLMGFFNDPDVQMIFDLSGGDSTNQILPFLDFHAIARSRAIYSGISDLSVLTNALYTCCRRASFHYRIKNLAGPDHEQQCDWFRKNFLTDGDPLLPKYRWLRGERMHGRLIGGNLRCFLKLAGTKYFPDPSGKIIFLESLGGGAARTASLLAQLDQIGVFQSCGGILIGTFTALQKSGEQPDIESLILQITERYRLPIAQTAELGHGENAFGIPVGVPLSFT